VLFECFAPADDARIAVVVALEAGRSGAHDAAPIARKILDTWLRFDDPQLAGNAAVIELGAIEPFPDAPAPALAARLAASRRSTCRCSARCCCWRRSG
jgi:hypothetical protein